MIEIKGRVKTYYMGTKEEKKAYEDLQVLMELERASRKMILLKGREIKR